VVGVIPAAGYGTRLGLRGVSKEVYPIGGRPAMDWLVERMVTAGCSELRVVTRPEKADVIRNARQLGAKVIESRPRTLAESLLEGILGVAPGDLVLLGFPDSIWDPVDGFRPLIDVVRGGFEVALGVFSTTDVEPPHVVEMDPDGIVTDVAARPGSPSPTPIWGCAVARRPSLSGLEPDGHPTDRFQALSRVGAVAGVHLSDRYVDIGTRAGLRRALALWR
jgi:glucose-1-phosphate thymidylyltransferase